MSENNTSRRKFLQALGIAAGAVVTGNDAISRTTESDAILKLNPDQQEFMERYGQWMEEFIHAARIRKSDPLNRENNLYMAALSDKAEAFKPELKRHLQDPAFYQIYQASIERISREI